MQTFGAHSAPLGISFFPSIAMTDQGLVCGAGSKLVRRKPVASGVSPLMMNDDVERLVAMLTAAFGRRFDAAEVLAPVSAAAAHWDRGDKALANFRLAFARLPRLRNQADADRLRLAEYVLDQGLPPDSLLKELGFAALSNEVRKYREDEPRVPAGFGEQGGRWTSDAAFGPSTASPTRVAEELPEEDEKTFEERRLSGATTRHEDIVHGRGGLLDTPGLPRGIGAGIFAQEPIPAGPGPKPNVETQGKLNQIGICHQCGTRDPGTKSGNMIGDHQRPTALIGPGEQQYYYPHCLRCSNRQGGLIKAFKYKKDRYNE